MDCLESEPLVKEKDVQSYREVKKIHEVTNHKGEEQLIWAYRNANLLNDEIRKIIKRVVTNCKDCQKFKDLWEGQKQQFQK